jgi:DNA-binding beta-propeller fold protein YncE
MVMYTGLDGGGAGNLFQTVGRPYDIAYDPTGNKLYWSQHFSVLPRDWGAGSYGIGVRDMVTGVRTTILSGLEYTPFGIAIDAINGTIYWTGANAVHRCNFDGSGVQTIVSEASSPRGIAVDPTEGKIYWGENGRIRQANLDGTAVDTVLDGLGQVIGLTLG